MTTPPLHLFERLKKNVLIEGNIVHIRPSECKRLSYAIFHKTGRRISETTLKRIYGFAHSRFNPSQFTIDVMAEYCGYTSWESFCEEHENIQDNNSSPNFNWHTTKLNADKVTSHTLKALKNKSGIPFNQTIRRQFINDHLDAFLQDDVTATALIAPSGHGKSIALCHWIDEQLELNIKNEKNDILLFFSSNVLVNNLTGGKNLNEWILSLLGYNTKNDVISMLEKEHKDGIFYFIIDGLDEYLFEADHFQLLLNELVDIISLYKAQSWFKVILTMRAATWVNNKHIINGQGNWFTGYVTDENEPVNVPFFNDNEINQLCYKIIPENLNDIHADIKKFLKNPLYFQLYYQAHPGNFCVKKIDPLSMHDLISAYILNKIYLGIYSTEKLLIIQGLVDAMDFKNKTYIVDKLKVNDLVSYYHNAYHELLSIGYLRELNTSNNIKFDNHIQFSSSDFLNHAIANVFLFKNNYSFDKNLIRTLNKLFKDDSHKLAVLKWCVICAVKNGQHENLKYIANTNLPEPKKFDLMLFINDLFEKEFWRDHVNNIQSLYHPKFRMLYNSII